ncbi:MAG: NTP transferase domain-containing protein [Desulfovibrio sp.]|jgi:D-glycero-alpha-D-manno-heptose 1-phosphate guanylyltransferase|nr:NTP transferase domain-containing protein [Desulfovibrio sp.]
MTALDTLPSEALILAGGLGSRLRKAVPNLPKPLVPVGNRPFLEFLLDYWLEQGIGRFVLSVGYLAECIMEHFGIGYHSAVIDYVRENEPLGTGGALALALQSVRWKDSHILLLNGDTWLNISLARFAAATDASLPVNMLLTKVAHNDRYGGVELDALGKVRSFGVPANGDPALINAGCYLLNLDAVRKSLKGFPPKFSLENDWLLQLAEQGMVGADVQTADFIDIGVEEDYRHFCRQHYNIV